MYGQDNRLVQGALSCATICYNIYVAECTYTTTPPLAYHGTSENILSRSVVCQKIDAILRVFKFFRAILNFSFNDSYHRSTTEEVVSYVNPLAIIMLGTVVLSRLKTISEVRWIL